MSDPVSNAEIEDVLSSIRRLVSTDESETTDAPRAVMEQADDRLVLTPALRVDGEEGGSSTGAAATELDNAGDAQDTAQPTQEMADEEPHGDSEDAVSADYDHVSEEVEATDPGSAEETSSDADSAGHDARKSAADEGENTDEAMAESRDPEDERHPEVPLAEDGAAVARGAALEDRIAEVEAAVAARDDQWEPDGETDDPCSGSDVTPMAWDDYAPEPQYDADEEDPAPEVAKLVIGGERWQAGQDEATAASAQDDVPQTGEAERKPVEAQEDSSAFWLDEDAVIDEDALRDMVSEIVRQELQGALGERITRNVRKLVRREIHRALTSQEFD